MIRKYQKLALVVFLFASGGINLWGQSDADRCIQELWPSIESKLEQPGADTTRYYLLRAVRDNCCVDYTCLFKTYGALMRRLERAFNLPAAIYLGEEMVRLAQRQHAVKDEAEARAHLSRYFDALGIERQATLNLDRALALYQSTGDQKAITYVRMTQLERSIRYRKTEDVLPDLEALLKSALENKDTLNATYLHIRLILHTQGLGLYDAMDQHIKALEQIPLSEPLQPEEYVIAIHAALGRADLSRARNNPEVAERFYQKALRLCEEEPSRWLEIYILQTLAELEWGRGREALAADYLGKAEAKAEKLRLDDLLARNYDLKARIAEAGGRYQEAIALLKKKHFHETEFNAGRTGFNMQNYYLQKENEQLALERERNNLSLRLKETRFRYFSIVFFLVLLLAAVAWVGYYKQRQGKQALAAQNELVRQQAEQLKTLDAIKSRFYGNISHELRTPLTLLLAPVNALLKNSRLSENQTRLLEMARRSGQQLEQLINDILDLRKLEIDKITREETPTPLAAFFRQCLAPFKVLAEQRQITFVWTAPDDPALTAMLDRKKCRQILNNLLANAFKFTPALGRIEADVTVRDGEIRIRVADTGPGIHPDDLPFIFDRFFQTTRPDKPASGGAGIGLALCREYARLLGGDVTVENAPGKGAVFQAHLQAALIDALSAPVEKRRVAVPEADQMQPPGENRAEEAEKPVAFGTDASGDSKPLVLIVEDHPDLQDYLQLILSKKYRVAVAENGMAALERLTAGADNPANTNEAPSVILSDLMMPFMDGFQLLKALRAADATRAIPFIVLTAKSDTRDKLQALRIGVDDYLVKPFDEEELLARVENTLRLQKARKSWQQAEKALETPAADNAWRSRLDALILEHITDFQFNIDRLAVLLNTSRKTLYRQVRTSTGMAVNQYIQEIRLQKARELLETGRIQSLRDLAEAVGVRTPDYLSRLYRERFGKSPVDYWM